MRLDVALRADEDVGILRTDGGGGVSTIAAGAGNAMTGVLTAGEEAGAAGCVDDVDAGAADASAIDCWGVWTMLSGLADAAESVCAATVGAVGAAPLGVTAGGAMSSVGTSCAIEGVADRARTAAIAARPGRAGLIAYLMAR